MSFIKLTPHMDTRISDAINNKFDNHRMPVNRLKESHGLSYSDPATVICMVNADQISRVYIGSVYKCANHADTQINRPADDAYHISPSQGFVDAYRFSLEHTVIELENGTEFSVLELPEYVSFLLSGRSARNWPSNVARYHTLPSKPSNDDEKSILEMDELPVSQNYIG